MSTPTFRSTLAAAAAHVAECAQLTSTVWEQVVVVVPGEEVAADALGCQGRGERGRESYRLERGVDGQGQSREPRCGRHVVRTGGGLGDHDGQPLGLVDRRVGVSDDGGALGIEVLGRARVGMLITISIARANLIAIRRLERTSGHKDNLPLNIRNSYRVRRTTLIAERRRRRVAPGKTTPNRSDKSRNVKRVPRPGTKPRP